MLCGALLVASACTSKSIDPPERDEQAESCNASTPKKLLECLLRHAKNQDFEKVREHVFSNTVMGMSTAEAAVFYMKNDPDNEHLGDFSYSHEALEKVIRSEKKFSGNGIRKWLRRVDDGGLVGDQLWEETKGDPKRFLLWQNEGCNILVVSVSGEYQLVFWEGLNKLLGTS